MSGGVGFLFSDLLGNHNLSVTVQARGTLRDIGGQVGYLSQGGRFNYGVSAGHTPLAQSTATQSVDPETGARRITRIVRRIYIDEVNTIGRYPLSSTRRFEVSAGAVRYGYDLSAERFVIGPGGGTDRRDIDLGLDEPDPIYVAQAGVAYVTDYSYTGFTSPLRGARYRFEVSPRVGTQNLVTVLADYRRYIFLNPIAFAVRGLHVGNYGAERGELLANEYLGFAYYPGFVRGYSFRSFEPEECPADMEACPAQDRLLGTRIGMASAELRVPLLGNERLGLINARFLPTEFVLFGDAGIAWTADDAPELALRRESNERIPVFSAGAALRVNLFGAAIVESFLAYPFQRPDVSLQLGFQLMPGW